MDPSPHMKKMFVSRVSPEPMVKVASGFLENDAMDLRSIKTTAIVDLLEDQIKRRDALLKDKLKKGLLK